MLFVPSHSRENKCFIACILVQISAFYFLFYIVFECQTAIQQHLAFLFVAPAPIFNSAKNSFQQLKGKFLRPFLPQIGVICFLFVKCIYILNEQNNAFLFAFSSILPCGLLHLVLLFARVCLAFSRSQHGVLLQIALCFAANSRF